MEKNKKEIIATSILYTNCMHHAMFTKLDYGIFVLLAWFVHLCTARCTYLYNFCVYLIDQKTEIINNQILMAANLIER